MDSEKLKEILENHKHWLNEDCDGWQDMRANLYIANLNRAELSRPHINLADLSGADISGEDISGKDL